MEYSDQSIEKFMWPVAVSRKIEAPTKKIWSVISSSGNLEICHPFCDRNPVFEWPGVGSKDAIFYYSGWVYQREFVKWIDGVGYDLIIGRKGGSKSYVTWRIAEEQENTGTLSITIYPHIFQNLPPAIRWIPYRLKIQPELEKYLQAVLSGFEWFVATGEPVQKNQFGSHIWFSRD